MTLEFQGLQAPPPASLHYRQVRKRRRRDLCNISPDKVFEEKATTEEEEEEEEVEERRILGKLSVIVE